MATTLTPTLQGSAYALEAAHSANRMARMYRIMGSHSLARYQQRAAAGYRRVAARALVLEQHKIVLSPSDVEWEAAQVPVAWRDHTSPASREREVRVERARKAYRAGLSGRFV